ncbi:MAG: DUF669 domain-containing protein [Prevotella sp.]
MKWDFTEPSEEEMKPKAFEPLKAGKYRVRIMNAEETVSKSSNNDMFKLTLEVSGMKVKVFHYLVMNPAKPERTNVNLGIFFKAFNISPPGKGDDINTIGWEGHTGGAELKVEQYENNEGEKRERFAVKYFLFDSDDLPDWIEPENSAPKSTPTVSNVYESDDIPF